MVVDVLTGRYTRMVYIWKCLKLNCICAIPSIFQPRHQLLSLTARDLLVICPVWKTQTPEFPQLMTVGDHYRSCPNLHLQSPLLDLLKQRLLTTSLEYCIGAFCIRGKNRFYSKNLGWLLCCYAVNFLFLKDFLLSFKLNAYGVSVGLIKGGKEI